MMENKTTENVIASEPVSAAISANLNIITVLCRAGTMDNYSYILIDEPTGTCAVVDPSEPTPIIDKLTQLGCRPDYILNTHHHFDHTDGNLALKQLYGAKVVGNQHDAARIPGFDLGVEPGGTFALGSSIAEIIDVSAHTQNHILYYFKDAKALFTGDTLFNLCIGGLFEGTAEQMFTALQKIKNLPADTLFYPGHEYTAYGAPEALKLLGDSPELKAYLQQADERLCRGEPVAPITLEVEKQCNPYLRAATAADLAELC